MILTAYTFIFQQTQSEWKIVFFIGAAIYFVGAMTFVFFAESDLQSWAFVPETTKVTEDEKNKNDSEEMRQRIMTYQFYHAKFISRL